MVVSPMSRPPRRKRKVRSLVVVPLPLVVLAIVSSQQPPPYPFHKPPISISASDGACRLLFETVAV